MSLPAMPMPGVSPCPEPFAPKAAPAALEDLRARLRATRWPDAPENAGWSIGADLDYLRELTAYWADDFDWTAQAAVAAPPPRYRAPPRRPPAPLRPSPPPRSARARPATDSHPRLARLVLALHQSHP